MANWVSFQMVNSAFKRKLCEVDICTVIVKPETTLTMTVDLEYLRSE